MNINPKPMLLCGALGAFLPIAVFSRDFARRLSWSLSGHTGPRAGWDEPLFMMLLFAAALGFFGAVVGYIIENVRGPDDPARDRRLAWLNSFFWAALGAFGALYVPRLQTIFDSFGSGLPRSTQLLLHGRPVFMLILGAAMAGAVYLKMNPAEPVRRKIIWACAGAGLLAAYWTVAALFAPMFMGSLAGS